MSSPTAVSVSPADYSPSNAEVFANAIRAGYRVAQSDHGWSVANGATVVETVGTKPESIHATIKHHSLDRAVQLHYAAALIELTAPAVAEGFTLLARRVEETTPSLAEIAAEECLSPPMDVLDAIIALAEVPTADLSEFTAIELHDAAQAAQAQRDAAAGKDFHAMMRLAAIAQRLHQEVDRRGGRPTSRSGALTLRSYPTYAEDYNTRRRRKRGGRW